MFLVLPRWFSNGFLSAGASVSEGPGAPKLMLLCQWSLRTRLDHIPLPPSPDTATTHTEIWVISLSLKLFSVSPVALEFQIPFCGSLARPSLLPPVLFIPSVPTLASFHSWPPLGSSLRLLSLLLLARSPIRTWHLPFPCSPPFWFSNSPRCPGPHGLLLTVMAHWSVSCLLPYNGLEGMGCGIPGAQDSRTAPQWVVRKYLVI